MRKTLTKPFSDIPTRIFRLRYLDSSYAKVRLLLPRITYQCPRSNFSSSSGWGFSASQFPPPEWVQPFNDLSDLVKDRKNLQPSPWVSQILNLLDNSPEMEQNLSNFCHRFLIKLSPNFVSFLLKSDKISAQPDVAFRFFTWAGEQKDYAHAPECYVSLIEVLSVASEYNRIRSIFADFKNRESLINVNTANSLIRSFGNTGMVEDLLWA